MSDTWYDMGFDADMSWMYDWKGKEKKMTIDEAIKHCEEIAMDKTNLAQTLWDSKEKARCEECAEEHNQLAQWLIELKMLKTEQQSSSSEKPNKWIPVSERLPESAFGCLVTVYDTDLRTQDEFENILPYFVGYDGETWNDADGEPIPFEVIAWMPLPKSYEPQERSDKDADKKCTYKETGCGSCKRQLDCPIEADKAESEG